MPLLPQVIDQFDIPAITRLFDETDFVGMSSYPSLSPRFKPDQLENALWQFAREIKYFGVNLEKVRCNCIPCLVPGAVPNIRCTPQFVSRVAAADLAVCIWSLLAHD